MLYDLQFPTDTYFALPFYLSRPTRAAKSKAISKLTTSVSEEPAAEPSSANAADGVVTEQTKIVSSVPKKIARFSHLSHVKDKVDAFEKYSGKFRL